MTTLWTPSDARIPRAALSQGNVTLRAGFVLDYCHECTHGQERVYRLAGVADPHVAVYHGPHEKMLVIAALYGTYRDAMMVLPRDADYVNVHQHCFHLWQCPESWGIR